MVLVFRRKREKGPAVAVLQKNSVRQEVLRKGVSFFPFEGGTPTPRQVRGREEDRKKLNHHIGSLWNGKERGRGVGLDFSEVATQLVGDIATNRKKKIRQPSLTIYRGQDPGEREVGFRQEGSAIPKNTCCQLHRGGKVKGICGGPERGTRECEGKKRRLRQPTEGGSTDSRKNPIAH